MHVQGLKELITPGFQVYEVLSESPAKIPENRQKP